MIYILRDPLKRLWSHIKFHHEYQGKSASFSLWSQEDFSKYIKQHFIWLNLTYAIHAKKVLETLNPDQFRIFYFEDLISNPKKNLRQLEDFLNISNFEYSSALLNKKVNQSKSIAMPPNLVYAAKGLLISQLEELKGVGVEVHPSWNTSFKL